MRVTRRELLIGGAAAVVVSMVSRPAWSAAAPARTETVTSSPLDAILGESPPIAAFRDSLRALLDRVSRAPRPPLVILLGETGVGKTLAARVLHEAGPRRAGLHVHQHFGAMPHELIDSILYGYAPGAVGTPRESPGAWELAAGGTLYLDEITLVTDSQWPRIARAIETGTVQRLGDTRSVMTDAWTITSTSMSLDIPIGERPFYELIAPLDPVVLTVPPLRERGDDVQRLADHFLSQACHAYGLPTKTLTSDARRALGRYPWPGNVRELSNVMERVTLLSSRAEIGAEEVDLPEWPARPAATYRARRASARRRGTRAAR
jgi:DNA-binding NtrC family response regulator